jgi:predicted lipid carrier protein YhbT
MPFALPAGLLLCSAALAFVLALGWRRRERALARELETLHERLQELSLRLEAAEQDAAEAHAQSAVNECLLLEKGVADEDEVEDARRLVVDGDASRDGEPVH